MTQERRGIDLLETLPQIDTTRIGFVGWSNGAHLLGGVMAGVDERVRAYALIGMARPASCYEGLESPVPKGPRETAFGHSSRSGTPSVTSATTGERLS